MPQCWLLPRACFRPPVSCRAGNDSVSSLATIFFVHGGGASIVQRIVAAGGCSRRLATLANRKFSVFSSALGLVERPGVAREKRAAVSGVVRHDIDPAAWLGCG